MKALSLIAVFFAVFMILLGIITHPQEGVLSDAVIIAGSLIGIFVATVWIIIFVKGKSTGKGETNF